MSQSNVSYVPPGSDVSYVSPADRDANCPRFMFILSVTAALHIARASNLQHSLKQMCFKCCKTIENEYLMLLCPFYHNSQAPLSEEAKK